MNRSIIAQFAKMLVVRQIKDAASLKESRLVLPAQMSKPRVCTPLPDHTAHQQARCRAIRLLRDVSFSRMEKCDNSSLSKILVDSLFLRHRLSLLVFIFKEENKCSLSVKIHRKEDFDRETLVITVKNNSISATIIIPKIFLFICERR